MKQNETIESTIKKLEESINNLNGIAPIAYWYATFTTEGKLKELIFSDQIRKMLGYSSKDQFSNTLDAFKEHVHPEDVTQALFNIIGFATEKIPSLNIEYRVLSASGKYIWCHTTGQLIRNHLGKALGMYGAFIDITSQIDLQKKLNEQQQLENVINAFVKDYEATFIRNLDDDSFSVISNKNDIAHVISKCESFTEAMRFYAYNYVNLEDIAKFDSALFEVSSTKENLEIGQTYSFEYRSKSTGDYQWCKITFNRISENEVLIGFLNCNNSVLQRMVTEKLMNDYDAIYICDLNNDTLFAVRSSRVSSVGVMEEKKSYSETVKKFAAVVNDKYKQDWLNFANVEYVKKYIGKENYREYVYELPNADKKMRRFAIDVIERVDGVASLVLASFMGIDDSRAQTILLNRKMAEQKKLLDYFVESYSSAYSVNLTDDSFEILHMSHDFSEVFTMDGNMDDMIRFIKDHVHPDDQAMMLRIISKNYVSNRFKTENNFTFVVREIFHNEQRTMRGVIVKGTDEFHIAVGFLDITDEIAKEKENQKRLEEALAMAQSANRAKTTFLNNMSHDIRTPMNAIIGYTDLAASHVDNKAQVQDFLKKIQQSSNHLLSLINDVLDMSRIESGKMNIDEKPENISEIIHVLRDIVQADIHSKQLNFYIDAMDVNDENIICDKLRLNQVLLNVLSNAIKYTGPGGTINMHVFEKETDSPEYGEYEFVVKDNGMGMSADFLGHIFEPFERVKSSTTSGIQGTGLGMAITKSIVDMMNGIIHINSELGVGTIVTIIFKFKLQGKHQILEKIEEYIGSKALVVDDDSNTCLSICNMLEDVGMDTEWCTTGKEALIRADAAYKKKEPFKVCIIDWLMPDMNGIETTRRIRKTVGDDAKIYILTAYDWADIEQEAYSSGVDGFISKPMFPSDLRKTLCKSLNENDENNKLEEFKFDGKKILLVEDNDFNREIAKDLLEEAGFVVDTAIDGTYAVDILKNAKPSDFDLVLMDIQMPIMDGYQATKAIRQLNSPISKIPILAMTANVFEEDRITALEAGMNEHIVKPIDVKNLKETIAKFVK